MKKETRLGLGLIGLCLLPNVAQAHVGPHLVENGLLAGLLHPFTGVDHLLAMLSIGIWAATQKGRMTLAIPATFLLALAGGFLLGVADVGLPMVESGIALSILLLGLLLATAVRLPAAASLTLTSLFAIFHGYAHGLEATGAILSFAVGFLSSSLLLHLSGVSLTLGIQQRLPGLIRATGLAIAASGVWLLS